MALDFPSSPTTGQVFNTYVFDGEKWTLPTNSSQDFVRYGAQILSSPQQTQARTNIGAGVPVSVAGNTGAFTLGTGLTNNVNDLRVNLSTLSSTLVADVALNNTSLYFTGPSIAQGSSGTWVVGGTVTLLDTAGVAAFIARISDGTNIYSSARLTSTGASNPTSITLFAIATNPSGNLRIEVRDSASTSGLIAFNNSGNSRDSQIWAFRIA
jgi:hypothetical protein